MGYYGYTAQNARGKVMRGSMFAQDTHELIASLRGQGLYCLSYREREEEGASVSGGGLGTRLKLAELVVFSNQMATMLSAGLTVMSALDILYNQERKPRVARVYLSLYEAIQKGDALSAAMRGAEDAFPVFLINMVESGETTGTLDTVMTQMSDYYERERRLKSKITNALVYPIFLAVLSVFVVIALFVFILPGFFALFENVDLPPLTRIMMAISNYLISDWYILLFAVFFVSTSLVLLVKIPAVRLVIDTLALKIPVAGRVSRMVATAKFSRTLAAMYKSGIPMLDALESIARILGNAQIKKRFEGIIGDIRGGETLSSAIKKTTVFEPMLYSMIYIGEETGSLDRILDKTAVYYDAEAENALQKMVTLIEPITIVLLGGVILLILASVLPVVYSMYSSI